jgi:erythromycin 3''-O-methyltransferase
MATTKLSSLLSDVVMVGKAIRLGRSSLDDQSRRLYELFPDNVLMTERTHYHNQGYWRSPADTLDDAGENLALLVSEQGGFRAGDRVLDAGFGYGDQDFFWLKRYGLAKVVGLNVTPRHVRFAQARAREQGLTDQLDFREGSATDMNFAPGSFDRVVAVESAFHFITREKFFRQAYEVLAPGGVLVTADVIPLNAHEAAKERKSGLFSFAYPDENRYDGEEYLARLKGAGFTNTRLTSIRDQVFEPWIEYTVRKLDDPDFRARVSKLSYRWLHGTMSSKDRMSQDVAGLDYVVVVAEKPA